MESTVSTTVSELNSRAFRLFLLAALATVAWVALSFALPDLAPAGIPILAALILISNAIILIGLWRGLDRTDFLATTKVAVWLAVAVPLALWFTMIWGLAVHGTFRPIPGALAGTYRPIRRVLRDIPPLPLAIFLPILVGHLPLTRSRHIASVLDATPPSWLIGLQVYRVLGSIFLVDWVQGNIPGAFAVPAGIGDIVVGLLALPAAVWVSSGTPVGRKAGIWWNLLGLADFAVAIAMGMMTSPGRFQVFARNHPNAHLGTFPTVMIPAFAVPNSIILHVLSLSQLKRLGRSAANSGTGEPAERHAANPASI
jgi:hypothetical protein